MTEDSVTKTCACGVPQQLARDPDEPVRFDDKLNEYTITGGHGRIEHLMRYCFWCGGSLPESRRSQLFCDPSDAESEEVHTVLKGVEKVSDVIELLGVPDGDIEPDTADGTGGTMHVFTRQLWYRQRWRTLDLFVNVLQDGAVSYAISPKHLSRIV